MSTQKLKAKGSDSLKPPNRKIVIKSKSAAPLQIAKETTVKSLSCSTLNKKPQTPKVPFNTGIKMPSASIGKPTPKVAKNIFLDEGVIKKVKPKDQFAVKNSKFNCQTKEIEAKLVKSNDVTATRTMTENNECVKKVQKTVNFLSRKSVSDVGFKTHQKTLNDKAEKFELAVTTKDYSFVKSSEATSAECDAHSVNAAMKISFILMLNVWQKKLHEASQLTKNLETMKKSNAGSRNQKLVVSTMLRMEQKRNQKLREKVDQANENLRVSRDYCVQLQAGIDLIKTEKKALERQLKIKDKQNDDLQLAIGKAQIELNRTISIQNDRRIQVNSEKFQTEMLAKKVKSLEEVINYLNQRRRTLSNELYVEFLCKNQQIEKMENEIASLQHLYVELKLKEDEIKVFQEELQLYKQECEDLRVEITNLEYSLKDIFVQRIKTYWKKKFSFSKLALDVLGCVAFCIMPVAPPPFIVSNQILP